MASRILAIGDVHGFATLLDQLLDAVAPAAGDTVITLGDYVDRGPDSRGVIDRLLRLSKDTRLVALRGNHEQMMLDARAGGADAEIEWCACGGDATVRSYATLGGVGTLADVPAAHWRFIEHTCVDWYETPTHFFVHANAYPDVPLVEQPTWMLQWESFDDPPPHQSGKVMVCGHTAQRSGRPRNIGHAVCIDTAVYRGGPLTCLDVTGARVWQAHHDGSVTRSWLDEYLVE